LLSLTGFSLVGGPAYSDASAAARDARHSSMFPMSPRYVTEFQTVERWEDFRPGACCRSKPPSWLPFPELDGATGSMVFGGRTDNADRHTALRVCARNLRNLPERPLLHGARTTERVEVLAGRLEKLVALRKTERAGTQDCADDFQLPAECRQHGHRSLPFGV
jgi:magnesium chelatase subunit H